MAASSYHALVILVVAPGERKPSRQKRASSNRRTGVCQNSSQCSVQALQGATPAIRAAMSSQP